MRVSTFIIGLLFVLGGVYLFMVNLGYGSWEFTRQLVKMWPVLLILAGLSLFWGGKIPRWLAFIIVIILSAGIVVLGFVTDEPQRNNNIIKNLVVTRADYPGVTAGELEIKFGGGMLDIGPSNGDLLEAGFSGLHAVTSVQKDQEKLKVSITQRENFRWIGDNANNNWEVNISPGLYWDLFMDTGAVKGNIDLSGVPFRNLNLNLGAGDVDLVLGNNGEHSVVKVDAGASDLKVKVPEGTGVKVKLDGAINNHNLNKLGWQVVNNTYTSPGYENAASRVDLDLDMAVGNFRIDVVN